MVTRCPSCDTLFRVTPPQLQAHRGHVRCGRCMTVFDGFAALATLPDQGALDPGSRAAAEPAVADAATVAPAPEPLQAEHVVAPRVEQVEEAASAPEQLPGPSPETGFTPAAPDETRIAAPSGTAGWEDRQREPVSVGAVPQEPAKPPGRRLRPVWAAGSALLLLALAAQALYAYRIELVASYPEIKPGVVGFCGLLGCDVPLPQRPRLVTIEASDLQVQDPLRPGLIQLTATLRNHAGFEVAFPALDLVLTNTKEHTLARRIFMPDDYLDRGRPARAGLPANAEITVRLMLDTGDLGAAGFRLALLPGR